MLLVREVETGWALWCLALKRPWRFGAEVPQRIVALVLKWPGRFGTGALGGSGPAKPRHRGGLVPAKSRPTVIQVLFKGHSRK